MKFTLSWLKDHLDTTAGLNEITAKLTAIGLEVESVEDPGKGLDAFVVAHVVEAKQHPNADRLRLCTVNSGTETLQVVCGAPNARTGLKVVLARPGAVIPISGEVLKKGKIRDVESQGMLCSYRELKLGEDHAGIIELAEDAPIGAPVTQVLNIDPVIEINLTPNRVDALGVYGIARDLAAAGLGTLKPLDIQPVAGSFPCPTEVRTDDPEGCPAFYSRVIRGVKNGPSPEWMQQRLRSAGQRPISALVDITNYLMLGLGRPAHAYDLATLTGAVVARRARDGEQVLALNEKTYTLDSGMTVIADDAGVHDIAGIMGGEHSGVSESTTDVLLEIAYFDPERIGMTGRKLGLTSDARGRFERGVDPAFLEGGLDLLTRLILDICGGEASEPVRAGQPPVAAKVVSYDPALAETLGGVAIPQDEQRRILAALGFTAGGDWQVSVPSWRPDVDGAPDIVEEVVRIHGLDRIESAPLPRVDGVARPTATPEQKIERRLRRVAAARGLNEAVTWSFLPEADALHFSEGNGALWVLENPISEDMKAMRPSLLPGLIAAAKRNLDRGASSVRLFELGRRYLRGESGVSDERLTLGVVRAGEKTARSWDPRIFGGKAAPFDAFDAKTEALALLAEAGAPVENLQVMGEAGPQFHPGQSATLRLGPKNVIARFGALHPATLAAFDVDGPVVAVELFLDAIPARKGGGAFARTAYAPPALQAVLRDFAFLVPLELPAGYLLRAVRGADKANIVDARIFDDFRGQGVPEGRKSLAVEITLQPGEKSYADADLKAIADKVVAAATKLGAELRG